MGRDIHLYVEKLINDQWVNVDQWKVIQYPDSGNIRKEVIKPFYSGRNFPLFNLLTNMYGYNRYGIKYIAKAKGFPDNVSIELSDKFNSCSDFHTPSYLTLQELMDFDWLASIKVKGFTNLLGYKYALQEDGDLNSYLLNNKKNNNDQSDNDRFISLDDGLLKLKDYWKKVETKSGEDETRDELFKTPEHDTESLCPYSELFLTRLINIDYEVNYIELVETDGSFFTNTMSRLKCLANGDLDSVRIVFWFDN